SLIIPFFHERVRNGIVMDRKQKIRDRMVGVGHALCEADLGQPLGDEQLRLFESGLDQPLSDFLCQSKIELEFASATRASSDRCLGGMPDIEQRVKARPIALRDGRKRSRSSGRLRPWRL